MKLIRNLIIIVVLLVVGLYYFRNTIAKNAVEVAAKEMTGFPLEIGSVDIGLLTGTLEVRDLKMMNPAEFHGGTFVSLPLVRVDYDTISFLRRAPHIKELTVNVAEVALVKNEKGETNATVLQNKAEAVAGSKSPSGTGSGGGSTPPKEEKTMPYRVDLVKVHVGTVIQRSFGKDGKPSEHKIDLNVDATYKDISESTSITKLVMDTVFGQLGSQLVGSAVKGLGDAGKTVGDTLQKSGKGLLDMFKK